MNEKLTKSLDKAAMAVGFVLFFGIMISAELRDGLGVATGLFAGMASRHSAFPRGALHFGCRHGPICQPDSEVHHGLGVLEEFSRRR